MLSLLRAFQKCPESIHHEDDEMSYVLSELQAIKQDTIHLVSDNAFEKLAYSYAFAQVRYSSVTIARNLLSHSFFFLSWAFIMF